MDITGNKREDVVKAGYKQTEEGVIPEDWDVKKIGQLCKLINGRGFKPFEWERDGLPIIRIQNLNGSDEFNYYRGIYDKKIKVTNGQLLFAWSGSRGTSFGPHIWYGAVGLLNYHTWKVMVNEDKIEPSFFLHALKQLTKFIEDNAHGASALVHTQKWEMEGFKFALPLAKTEQTAIAKALSDTDALIQSLNQLITKKRQIKQGAMQQLLNPYDKGGELKAGWMVKRLDEIAPLQRGFDLPNIKLIKGNYPVVYSNGVLNYHHKFMVKGSGIVTGRSGTLGAVHFIDNDFWPHNTTLWVTTFFDNDPKFIFYLFNRIGFSRFGTGSGVPTLNRNDAHDFKIGIPENKIEQTQIAKTLTDIDTEITNLETKRAKYQQIKQGMMQNLLTGRIRLV